MATFDYFDYNVVEVLIMHIKKFVLGDIRSNCYIVYQNHKALVIDPGFESQEVYDFINNENLEVTIIYATHGHLDHVGGINALKQKFPNAVVYAPKRDIDFLDVTKGYSRLKESVNVDYLLDNDIEQVILFEGVNFRVIHTPGHSKGGTCLYANQTLFSGDTLFYQTVGRTDLHQSSFEELKSSILEKLYTLPDETICYPGHGSFTTIGHEKKSNVFVRL